MAIRITTPIILDGTNNMKTSLLLALLMLMVSPVYAAGASWYDSKSVCKEGTCCAKECPTASGLEINALEQLGKDFCAASRDYKMGAILHVTNKVNGKSVDCVVVDRGGFDKKYKRSVDLSKSAFAKIADPRLGVVDVTIDVVGQMSKKELKKLVA
jgi:rare lipoprotein A (peptidoglycan hydrolase)